MAGGAWGTTTGGGGAAVGVPVSHITGILALGPNSMVFCNTSTSAVGGASSTGNWALIASKSGSMSGSTAFFSDTLGLLIFLQSHGMARRKYS
eukprot:CAMPEP_0201631352 /NCGR_PEP_ID=MMETSP0493-20130528/5368_1 /ASSEMBLY_ACC=CAM_ASM_000838 /TAXON_ID=420259 /ORGANISM="Thalassiosira gravida, Strain GMp14c1" /LENGTH=92 /DNA_ID=CAMNT_0048102675 /DNA_START=100 /DNA_END=378 /DNA_ORIENTATION=+